MVANHSRQIALFSVAECWRCSIYLTTMECLVIKLVTNTNHAFVTNATTGNREGFCHFNDNDSICYQRISKLVSCFYVVALEFSVVDLYEISFHCFGLTSAPVRTLLRKRARLSRESSAKEPAQQGPWGLVECTIPDWYVASGRGTDSEFVFPLLCPGGLLSGCSLHFNIYFSLTLSPHPLTFQTLPQGGYIFTFKKIIKIFTNIIQNFYRSFTKTLPIFNIFKPEALLIYLIQKKYFFIYCMYVPSYNRIKSPTAVMSSYYNSISLVRVKFLHRIGLILHQIGLIL